MFRKLDRRLVKIFVIGVAAFFIVNSVSGVVAHSLGVSCSSVGMGCYYKYSGFVSSSVSLIIVILVTMSQIGRRAYRLLCPINVSTRWILLALSIGVVISTPVFISYRSLSSTDVIRSALTVPQSVFEELIFRGVLYCALRKYHWMINVLTTSMLFAFLHVPTNLLQLFVLVAAGVLLWVLRYKSKSIAVPVVVHVLHNIFVFM